MKRKFARLKGTGKACDDYAQENNRRPFVFGFVTNAGNTVWRDGSIPFGMDKEYLSIWYKLCHLCELHEKPVRKKRKATK